MGNFIVVTKKNVENKFWKRPRDMSYARNTSFVPVSISELNHIALCFPLVFSKTEKGGYLPVALLNIKPGKNLFVDENNRWIARYIPQFFIGHPFRIAFTQENKPVLIVDEDYLSEDEGNPFFKDDESLDENVKNIFRFLLNRQRDYQAIIEVCKRISETDIFEPFSKIKIGDQEFDMKGFYRINPDKFRKLNDEKFLSLRNTGAFNLIYAHIFSLPNFNILVNRLKVEESKERISIEEILKNI